MSKTSKRVTRQLESEEKIQTLAAKRVERLIQQHRRLMLGGSVGQRVRFLGLPLARLPRSNILQKK